MSISKLAVQRPVTVTMAVAAFVVFGFVSVARLALDWMPHLRLPVIGIVTVYPGAAPISVEGQITTPVESAIAAVPGIRNLESYSMENLSVVIATFEPKVNSAEAVQTINAHLATLAAVLPSDAMDPVVTSVDPRLYPLMTIGVTGKSSLDELTRIAETSLKPALEQTGGVSKASVVGGASREISVIFDTDAMRANNITPYTLVELLPQQNAIVPAGILEDNGVRYNVRVGNPLTGAEDIANLVIGQKRTTGLDAGGFGALIPQQLFIKDIAEVVEGVSPQAGFAHVNGQMAVTLHVFKDTGANSVKVSREVARTIQKLNEDPRLNVHVEVLTDQSQFITNSLGNLRDSAIIGSLLAIAVLFVFVRAWRSILVIALAIPLSIIVSLTIMYSAGLTLNMMSLGGLALGVGMLVDNAIVVLENIMRHRREGKDPATAAEIGASEVSLAISASTLTTVVVFLPLAYLQSSTGQWFRDMALTVTFSLCASLLVAITVVPAAAARMLGRNGHAASQQTVELSDDLAVEIKETGWIGKIQSSYLSLLAAALRRPLPVLCLVLLLIAGGAMGLRSMSRPELLPSIDGGIVNITLTMPPGTPTARTDAVAQRIENSIADIPEVTSVWSQAGQQSDNLLSLLYSSGSNVAHVHAGLLPLAERRRRAEAIAAEVKQRLASVDLEGGQLAISAERVTDTLGEDYRAGATIELLGPNFDDLNAYVDKAADAMRRAGGFSDIRTSVEQRQPELIFTVNRTKALIGQMTTGLIGLTFRGALTGLEATRVVRDGVSIPVVLRPQPDQVANLENLLQFPLQGLPSGNTPPPSVKFGKVVSTESAEGPLTIRHVDRQRMVSVQASLEGIDLSTAERRARQVITELDLPAGMSARVGGIHATIAEAASELTWALVLAVALVYMVMAAQFESFRYPFIVMFTVPIGVGGGLVLLWLSGQRLGVPAMMGLIILVGVAVNNAIVLVDAINRQRAAGVTLREAIYIASRNRLRPILMTSLTTIFGLIPLALGRGEGSEMQVPLALGFMGGMVTSTFLTLFVTPMIYYALARFGFSVPKSMTEPAGRA